MSVGDGNVLEVGSGDGCPLSRGSLESLPSLVLSALAITFGVTGAGLSSASDSPASLGGTFPAFTSVPPASGWMKEVRQELLDE